MPRRICWGRRENSPTREPCGAARRQPDPCRGRCGPAHRREKVGRCDPPSGAGAACLLLLFAEGAPHKNAVVAAAQPGSSFHGMEVKLPKEKKPADPGRKSGCIRRGDGRRHVRHRAWHQRLVAPPLSDSSSGSEPRRPSGPAGPSQATIASAGANSAVAARVRTRACPAASITRAPQAALGSRDRGAAAAGHARRHAEPEIVGGRHPRRHAEPEIVLPDPSIPLTDPVHANCDPAAGSS
jgi:hypothetical protein